MDVYPNDHALYLGNLSSAENHARAVVREADLVIAVGTRLNQPTSANYTLPAAGQKFIHIHADEETIGQNTRPMLGIVADARLALEAANALPAPAKDAERGAWIAKFRAVQEKYATPPERPSPQVSMEKVMRDMKTFLPKDTIHTVDAGNFALWVHKYIDFTAEDSFLGPTVGSMGYGVPAAIAAKLAHPTRTVIANCGDGGFLMTGQEMATAVQFNVPIITMVYNNRAYGTIRMHQEKQFPGRPSGTDMVSPDFATLARGYGALGFKVERDADFLPALEEAKKSNRPALIEVSTDLEMLSPSATLSEVTKGNPGR
jgi:acetolactate synthase-1/2/3 large subunit